MPSVADAVDHRCLQPPSLGGRENTGRASARPAEWVHQVLLPVSVNSLGLPKPCTLWGVAPSTAAAGCRLSYGGRFCRKRGRCCEPDGSGRGEEGGSDRPHKKQRLGAEAQVEVQALAGSSAVAASGNPKLPSGSCSTQSIIHSQGWSANISKGLACKCTDSVLCTDNMRHSLNQCIGTSS